MEIVAGDFDLTRTVRHLKTDAVVQNYNKYNYFVNIDIILKSKNF